MIKYSSFLSLLFIFISLFTYGQQKQGQVLVDSLLNELPKVKDDTNKVAILNNISFAYAVIKPDEGLKYGQKALELANKLNCVRAIPGIIQNIGTNYSYKNDYQNALANYLLALKDFEKQPEQKKIGSITMDIGTIYLKQSNCPVALNYFLKSLSIYEKIGHEPGIAEVQSNIGNVYFRQKNLELALDYYHKSAKTFEEIGDKMNFANLNGNIGSIYYMQNKIDSALTCFINSLNAEIAIGSKNGISTQTANIASIYLAKKNYSKALEYYFNGMEIGKEINDKNGIILNAEDIGCTYIMIAEDTSKSITSDKLISKNRIENIRAGIDYLNKAVRLCRDVNDSVDLLNSLSNLSEAYTLLNDYKNAFKCYQECVSISDSVFNIAKTRTIAGLQADFDKKQAAAQAATEKKIALATEKNKRVVLAVSGSFVFLFSLAGIFFYRRRENDRFKLEIATVKQEALNAQMSDHFISNTMDSINGFIRNNDKEKASEYLILFSRLIRRVLENATEKTIPLNDDLAILRDYLELEKLRFAAGELQYEINEEEGIDGRNALIPPMVFQVLAENAIKHGFSKTKGGKIQLNVTKKEDTLECTVQDNGVGRSASVKQKEETGNSRSSYGSSLAEKLVKLGGRYVRQTSYKIIDLFDVNNNPAGTKVVFTLPYILAD